MTDRDNIMYIKHILYRVIYILIKNIPYMGAAVTKNTVNTSITNDVINKAVISTQTKTTLKTSAISKISISFVNSVVDCRCTGGCNCTSGCSTLSTPNSGSFTVYIKSQVMSYVKSDMSESEATDFTSKILDNLDLQAQTKNSAYAGWLAVSPSVGITEQEMNTKVKTAVRNIVNSNFINETSSKVFNVSEVIVYFFNTYLTANACNFGIDSATQAFSTLLLQRFLSAISGTDLGNQIKAISDAQNSASSGGIAEAIKAFFSGITGIVVIIIIVLIVIVLVIILPVLAVFKII